MLNFRGVHVLWNYRSKILHPSKDVCERKYIHVCKVHDFQYPLSSFPMGSPSVGHPMHYHDVLVITVPTIQNVGHFPLTAFDVEWCHFQMSTRLPCK